MNNVSVNRIFHEILFFVLLFFILTVVFLIALPRRIALAPITLLIPSILFMFRLLNVADIKLDKHGEIVMFLYLFKTKTFSIDILKIYNIDIDRNFVFVIETNICNIYLHYTKTNYNILLDYLEFINYGDIFPFMEKVRMKLSQPI
jgi:hypothetical protein